MAEIKFPLSGGCQCGAVRFHAKSLRDNPHVCHCRMCQKASGNFFAALVGVPLVDLTWTRGKPARFSSSEGIDRGFCSACGTPLFFQRLSGENISISIAVFDTPNLIPLAFELGNEGRMPQLMQLGNVPAYGSSEEDDPEGASLALGTNRQHPDHDTDVWPR
jgi:hypothetical protein